MNKDIYSSYRNKLINIIRKSKHNHYTYLIKASQGDSKKSWKVLNEVLNKSKNNAVLPNAVGLPSNLDNKYTHDINLANNCNNYFNSIGEKLSNKIVQPQGITFDHYLRGSYANSFFMKPTNCDEVYKIITNLRSSYTAGEDEISGKILKVIAFNIMEPLTYCINLSLFAGIVPKRKKNCQNYTSVQIWG